jgi:hypothetical protein
MLSYLPIVSAAVRHIDNVGTEWPCKQTVLRIETKFHRHNS